MPKRICVTLLFTVAIAIVMLSAASFVKADAPAGVPVIPLGPMECITGPGGYFKVTAVPIQDEFPFVAPCPTDPLKECSEYKYTVAALLGKNTDHTVIMVSADQYLVSTAPSSSVPDVLGDPDSTTKIGLNLVHEYPVRFNENASTYDFSLLIEGPSTPEPTTVFVSSGNKINEKCSIAGAGDPGNPYEFQTDSQEATGAGGQIDVVLKFVNNKLVKVIPQCEVGTEGCYTGTLTHIKDSDGVSKPVQHLEATITFGDNTTTCWPLSPPFCVCTRRPCP